MFHILFKHLGLLLTSVSNYAGFFNVTFDNQPRNISKLAYRQIIP